MSTFLQFGEILETHDFRQTPPSIFKNFAPLGSELRIASFESIGKRASSRDKGLRTVKISVTVTFERTENDQLARAYAYLMEKDIVCSSGDVDGRVWMQIFGEINEAALLAIMVEISK